MVSIRKIAASAKTSLTITGLGLLIGIVGCGSSTSNNDQGTSFGALGFFSSAIGSPPPGVAGLTTTLSSDPSASGGAVGLQTLTYIGLENRLRTQFIRVTKVDCEYFVPGSNITIPPDSTAVNGFINASPDIGGPQIGGTGGSGGVGAASGSTTGGTTGGSTGSTSGGVSGGNATGISSKTYLQFPIINSSIYAYINSNRNGLPALPFQLQVVCTATGISQAGDAFTTNPVALSVDFEEFVPGAVGASGVTSGTGGNSNSFDAGGTGNDTTTTAGSGTGTTTGAVTSPEGDAANGEVIPVS